MAVVLGISAGPHDSAACLYRGGELRAAAAEERFTRRKMDGRFPDAAIAYCLDSEGLTVADVEIVAHGWRFGATSEEVLRHAARVASEVEERMTRLMLASATRFDEVDRNVEGRVLDGLARLGIPRAKLRMYDHHLCHAAAALYLCPYPGATAPGNLAGGGACCVTLDGRGDFASGKVVVAGCPRTAPPKSSRGVCKQKRGDEGAEFVDTGEELVALDTTSVFDSIGFLWAFVTASLGFKPFRHEGKVTGLAARGDAAVTLPVFEDEMGLAEDESAGRWIIRTKWHEEPKDNFHLYLSGLESPAKDRLSLQDFTLHQKLSEHRREDVAAGLQTFTEQLVLEYLDKNRYVRPVLCLSGGVFANVRLNMRLRKDLPGVDSVFVYPNMGDGGLCAGAAAIACRELGQPVSAPKGAVFLGPEFGAEEVKEALQAFDARQHAQSALMPAPRTERICDERAFARAVAEHLSADRVVGLFYGAMEFGPRALGHRSLLAQAKDPAITDRLNARLRRSEFMPFAPVTLRELAGEAYADWNADDAEAGRHMTMCYEVTAAMREMCPAIVHLDGTARPQVVDERDGLYFHVVREYWALTRVHTLINTSFNLHEEPIVCTPSEAVAAFAGGACDVLAAYPFLASTGATVGEE